MSADDRAAGVLAAIRDLVAQRDELVTRAASVAVSTLVFNAAQDRLAEEVPRLLAAVEAAMTLADRWDGQATDRRSRALQGTRAPAWHPDHPERLAAGATERETCARSLRAAITAALTGEDRK